MGVRLPLLLNLKHLLFKLISYGFIKVPLLSNPYVADKINTLPY